MALPTTLEELRSSIIDSIKGRKLGIDKSGDLVGFRTARRPGTAFTSASTGTNIPAYGHTTITCASAATVYVMDDPIPGEFKTITNISTGGPKVTLTNAKIRTALGTTNTFILWTASSSGQTVMLVGESTANYALVTSLAGSTVSAGSTGITIA